MSSRWDAVESNLRHTLRSIRASRNVDPLVVIACHDVPDLKDDGCENLQILPVPFAPELAVSQRGADKIRKRWFIGTWLKSNIPFDGIYVMFLDADDLVHKDLAAWVLDNDNRRSYLVDKGYRFDCRSGLLDRRSTEFYRVCASSFIGYFRKEELPGSWEDADCAYAKFGVYPPHGHGQYGLVAAQLGKHSDTIPFYAVTYMMNHGESLRSWKSDRRVRYLSIRHLVRPSQAKRILVDDFSFESRDWATWTMREKARIVSVMFSACFHKSRNKLRPRVQNRASTASGGRPCKKPQASSF